MDKVLVFSLLLAKMQNENVPCFEKCMNRNDYFLERLYDYTKDYRMALAKKGQQIPTQLFLCKLSKTYVIL